jgi:hypothetical protein
MRWHEVLDRVAPLDTRALDVPHAYADDPFNSQTLPRVAPARQKYSHLHQQYAQTPQGASALHSLASRGAFGTCPRYMCLTQGGVATTLLPVTRDGRVLGYCCQCREAYVVSALSTLSPELYGDSSAQYLEMEYPAATPFQRTIFGFRIVPDPDAAQPAAGEVEGQTRSHASSPSSVGV